MVALVLVSHSRALALALKETLEKLYTGKGPPVAVAAGAGENGEELGTDATAIMAAIEAVGAVADGVLVLLDLGSAVLSAELALELLDEPLRGKVVLCSAPLVEGAIAAAAQSSIGATLGEVRAEAEGALRQKIAHLGTPPPAAALPAAPPSDPSGEVAVGPSVALRLRVENPHGLHARPAMRIVQTVAAFSSAVQIENLRTGAPPVSARSLVAITCLDARLGDTIRITASGDDAAGALQALETLHAAQFGDAPEEAVAVEAPVVQKDSPKSGGALTTGDRFPCGEPLAEGLAMESVFFVPRRASALPPPVPMSDVPAEIARLHAALSAVRRELAQLSAAISARLGLENAAILEAQQMLAADPALVEPAVAFIRDERLPATHAWQQAAQLAAESYRRLQQPLLRERARDVDDLSQRVLRELGVETALSLDLPADPCILAVPTLLPSEVVALDKQKVRGIIAEAIGQTSHAAILLRAAGIAAVDGVDLMRLRIVLETTLDGVAAIDGGTGEVWLSPTETMRREFTARRQAAEAIHVPSSGRRAWAPLHTRDGRRVELAANVTSPSEAAAAAQAGAEGIGLLRTEFLFFGRSEPPGEDEQVAALQHIADALPPDAPVTVRTFDIGGDKPVPYLSVPPEENPFLGVRGLRLALRHRVLFLAHLRAILRAASGRRFRVMFPMVTEVEEICRARALLTEAHETLARTGTNHAWPVEVGMMVEVPAAALNAHHFVPEVDFFSIGTNDLTQYTLAAERGHPQLTGWADALHPAVLRLVRRVAVVAARGRKWVGVCGEAAADPVAAGVFIGLGMQELSVGPAALARLRQSVEASDYRQNRRKALLCLKASSAAEVRRLWRE